MVMMLFCNGAKAGWVCDIENFMNADVVAASISNEIEGQAHFYDRSDECEEKDCPQQEHLLPGDQVLVSVEELYIPVRDKEWACAYFRDAAHDVYGWLRLKQLYIHPKNKSPPDHAWVGQWSYRGNQLDIEPRELPRALWVKGSAQSLNNSAHTSTIEGLVRLADNSWSEHRDFNWAEYNDGDCFVFMMLIGQWLVAGDNNACGKRPADFAGIYHRTPPLARLRLPH